MRHAGYRQHARTARSLRSLAASRSSAGGIVTLRQVGSRACPAPSVARVGLRVVSILRVGALLLERGVAGVSRGVLWFGGALRAQCLPVAHAAGVPPRPPKALAGLRSLRSRTASRSPHGQRPHGIPKGRGLTESTRAEVAPPALCAGFAPLKAVSCRGFAAARRSCRLCSVGSG